MNMGKETFKVRAVNSMKFMTDVTFVETGEQVEVLTVGNEKVFVCTVQVNSEFSAEAYRVLANHPDVVRVEQMPNFHFAPRLA